MASCLLWMPARSRYHSSPRRAAKTLRLTKEYRAVAMIPTGLYPCFSSGKIWNPPWDKGREDIAIKG